MALPLRDGDLLVVRRTVAVVSDPSRSSRRRTGASRRARRKELGLTRTSARTDLGIRLPHLGGRRIILLKCSCGKRLADVDSTCQTPPGLWSTRDLTRAPFSEAIRGHWRAEWTTDLNLRNRKGIAGETHLEGRWRVTCPKCQTERSGLTYQLVALILEERRLKSGEVVLSGPNLDAVALDVPERLWQAWTQTYRD